MNMIDQYIAEVMRNICAPREPKKQFEADLRTHFDESSAAGESENAAIKKMGDPIDVAGEFMANVTLEYANFGQRFLAFLTDLGFCLILALPLYLFLFLLPHTIISPSLSSSLTGVLGGILGFASHKTFTGFQVVSLVFVLMGMMGIFLLYFPVLEKLFGRTLGKHLLRIQVVRESGRALNWGDAIVRRLSYYFDILPLDALFIFFSKKRQRAFDIVAKTVVIKEPYLHKTWLSYVAAVLLLLIPPTVFLVLSLFCLGIPVFAFRI